MKRDIFIILFLSLIVGVVLFFTFRETGSPAQKRSERFDQKRVSSLQNLKYAIESHYRSENSLPESLSDLNKDSYYTRDENLKDPESGKSYEYSTISKTSYKLCATFAEKTPERDSVSYYSSSSEFKHPKGHHCFEFKVTPRVTYTPPTSTTKEIADTRIKSVSSSLETISATNFPYAFFDNSASYGLISYDKSGTVTLTVTFKEPEQLDSISNTFGYCYTAKCYRWSAVGITSSGTSTTIVKSTNVGSESNEKPATKNVSSNSKFSKIKIKVARVDGKLVTSSTGNSYYRTTYLYWKKLKFEYKEEV